MHVLQRRNALFDGRVGREQLANAASNAHGSHALGQFGRVQAAKTGQGVDHRLATAHELGGARIGTELAPTRTWSPGTALPDSQTHSQPALTMWNNILWCVFRGASDQGLWCAAYYQGQWSTPSKFTNGNETGFGPALVAGEIDGAGALLCLHSTKINALTVPGLTQSLWWSEFQGAFVNERANRSADTEFDQGNRAFASPAWVFYGGRFYCVHRGQASQNDGAGDQSLWYCRFDGRNWAADQQFEGGNRSQAGVALAILDFL